MPFRVIFLPRAMSDVENAIDWLAERSPAAADRWLQGMLSIVENLELDPKRYSIAEEAAELGVDLRQIIHGRRRGVYRVLFTIEGNRVNVLRVRHSAQDELKPPDLS
jgi:plasmid stabilization system protein ParE